MQKENFGFEVVGYGRTVQFKIGGKPHITFHLDSNVNVDRQIKLLFRKMLKELSKNKD